MSWAGRRKGLYIGTMSAIFLAVFAFVLYTVFSHPTSCFNGTKDGTELDIDCGGACSRMCMQEVRSPIVLWSRFLPVAPSTYTAAAYIENQNVGAYVKSVRYTFKLFDAKNVLIAERQGIVSIAPTRITPIIEANINTGNRVPTRAFFEFLDIPLWDKAIDTPAVRVSGQDLDAGGQRLSVVVHNDSTKNISSLPVAAVLFDENGAAQAASVSIVPSVEKGGQAPVFFTWPTAPLRPVVRAEVIALPTPR